MSEAERENLLIVLTLRLSAATEMARALAGKETDPERARRAAGLIPALQAAHETVMDLLLKIDGTPI